MQVCPPKNQKPRGALSQLTLKWIEKALDSLSIDEALGQLICPEDRGYSEEDWIRLFQKVPLGSVFEPHVPAAHLQKLSRVPLLVAADLEHGAGPAIRGGTDFPWAFGIGAANSVSLTQKLGVATAREARSHGVNWTLSPCVDLALNHNNPVVNIRSLGDDPRRVARLASTWIKAMQSAGLAACAKHFPGDGVDDRDQHLCTSVNSMDRQTWWRSFGFIWREVIQAGVMSIMAGHISLPFFEGLDAVDAPPATLSERLQVDLLRRELGFDGVIVSDAAPMIGLTSRVKGRDAVVRNLLSGSDVFLFADPEEDFGRLKAAWKKGTLSEARIRQSVRRVLTMKAGLGLHRPKEKVFCTATDRRRHAREARAMAEQSIILYRKNHATPLSLHPGSRVLTVTLRYENGSPKFSNDLPWVDEELRKRGHHVTHFMNPPHRELLHAADRFAGVFINFAICPHAQIGTVRLIGSAVMPLWRAFWLECPQAVFTTFGSPYHIHELPHLPNFWMAGGPSEVCQRAAVKAWLGEIRPTASCPVRIP